MSSNNWERVERGKGKVTKSQKRQEVERMPKQSADVAPLKTQSMFDAIDDKPKGGSSSTKQPLQDRSNVQGSPKGKRKPKKSKKLTVPEFQHPTCEEAIKDVNVLEVFEAANKARDSQTVWQKSIIAMINDAISCPEESQNFSNKGFKYPLSKVPKTTYEMMKKLYIDETNEDIKTLLFDFCLKSVMDLMTKDRTTWGYRLCIQLLAHHSPSACFEDAERHYDEICNMKNCPKKCLSYMWAIGQVGVNDIRCGMRVWLGVMLPLLRMKNLAQYVVHYLETLLNSTSNPQKDLSGTINADEYVQILKWTYDPTMGLTPNLRDRLHEVHGTVRLIATADPERKKAIFERFLRTPVGDILGTRRHFLDVVFQSMRENPKCLESWSDESTYSSSLPQTKLLLEYIDSKWGDKVHELPKDFEGTIRTFIVINRKAASQSNQMTSVKEFKTVKNLCQEFLRKFQKKSEQTRSRCNGVVLSVLIAMVAIAVGLFIYDVNLHGGKIEKSLTYKTLEKSGALSILRKVWTRISDGLQTIAKWLGKNIPYYWSHVSDVLGPYLHYFVSLLGDFLAWILEVTAPVRAVIVKNTEAILVWADGTFHKIFPGAHALMNNLNPYLLSLSQWLDAKGMAVFSFLKGEIGWCCIWDAVGRNAVAVYETACNLLSLVWSYLLYLLKAASDYVSGENMQ